MINATQIKSFEKTAIENRLGKMFKRLQYKTIYGMYGII